MALRRFLPFSIQMVHRTSAFTCRTFCDINHHQILRTNPIYSLIPKSQIISRNITTNNAEEEEENAHVRIKQYLSTLNQDEQERYCTEQLSKLSDIDKRRLKVLEMEYDVWQSTGGRIPDNMTNVHWYQLLNTPSASGRMRLYSFLFKLEKIELSNKKKQQSRQEAHLQRKAAKKAELVEKASELGVSVEELPLKPGIFMVIREQTMNMQYYSNLAWSMQFGQPLVWDMSYEHHMKGRERSSLISQMMYCHGINKLNREPFHFCMTGIDPNGFIARAYFKQEKSFVQSAPVTATSTHHLEMFPREKLVYLTPDSNHELHQWNHNDIYVIGGIVDLGNSKPYTMANAKREGIRTAKFPLDKYLKWAQGSKGLTLDTLMKIILDVKDTGDWPHALRHVPAKKALLRPKYHPEFRQIFKDSNK